MGKKNVVLVVKVNTKSVDAEIKTPHGKTLWATRGPRSPRIWKRISERMSKFIDPEGKE